MTIRPGRNLVRLVCAVLVLSLGALLWWPIAWAIPVAIAAIGFVSAAEYRRLMRRFDGLSVSISAPTIIGRGRAFAVAARISAESGTAEVSRELSHEGATAGGRMPLLRGDVRVELPSECQPNFWIQEWEFADGRRSTEFHRSCQVPVRGLYEFGPVWVRLRGDYDLLECHRRFDARQAVRVLPEGFSSRDELAKDQRARLMLLDKMSRSRFQGPGTEFESLSEFREGDDPRRMDWRATARMQRPIVRRFQIERHRDLMILLDCGRLMGAQTQNGTKLDAAVDAALMLARVALHSGDRCGVGIFDDRVLGYLPPITGLQAMQTLTESVYALQPQWRESDFSPMFATLQSRQPKRSLVVVLSDIVDGDTTRRYRASLARLARRHVILVAALKTPLLEELQTSPVESLLDGSRKAVAFRLLRERERALHSLSRSGVHVLDVEPSDLTVPLVNQFLELRQHQLG